MFATPELELFVDLGKGSTLCYSLSRTFNYFNL